MTRYRRAVSRHIGNPACACAWPVSGGSNGITTSPEDAAHVLLTALLILLAGMSLAQGNLGSIRGTISDATGAALPDAQVIVTSEATGVFKTLTTSSSGFYSADALSPGDYSIRVSKDGFSPTTLQHITVDPGQTRASRV